MADCCSIADGPAVQAPGEQCPQCGTLGWPVARETVRALVKAEARDKLKGAAIVFCPAPACPAAYCSSDGAWIAKEALRVRVGIKETEEPILVCYCFGITQGMIHDEMTKMGRSTASRRVRGEIKAGHCRCEVENPSGRCCLGDVIRTEKQASKALRDRGKESPAPVQGAHDPARPSGPMQSEVEGSGVNRLPEPGKWFFNKLLEKDSARAKKLRGSP